MRAIIVLILLFTWTAAWAQSVSFDAGTGLPIRIGDRVVLEVVREPLPDATARRLEGETGYTLLRPSVRQEFALAGARGEYTFEYHLPASDGAFEYLLHVPLEIGDQVRVSHGSYRYTSHDAFTIGNATNNFVMARFIEVSSARGTFAIDLDPLGSWQDGADLDAAMRTCRVRATEAGLDVAFVRGANQWGGGRIMGKLVVHPVPTPFEQIHPFNTSSYKTSVASQHFLDFTGAGKFATGLQPYDAERGHGWVDANDTMKLVRYRGKALFHSALIRGEQSATYRLKAEPGWHMLTLHFGDREQPVGPLRVTVNGIHRVIGLELEPARFTAKRMIVECQDGMIDIEFAGRPWSIAGLILQPLLTRQEDYLYTRPWWNQKID